ncbi:hypothetical protein Psuf_057870 [Phytohabitans suffuscus]|uniref:Uncharacterized protein n=1 Tax=Phytohabitans suffuscus TaxID=624315 RepID=A0A6F8YQW1_9ACTN|nr:hypothetical protein [Phytohabitans suffuscus]BCB88474.1 hypothetical protein Psuf_057870 [Phytohabitans suffuscus]
MTESQTVAKPPAVVPPAPGARRVRLARFRDLALVPAILLLVIVGAVIDPVFLTKANITNVLQQQTELSLLVLAEAIILIAGKFDLSLESTIGLARPSRSRWSSRPPATASAPRYRSPWRSRSAC